MTPTDLAGPLAGFALGYLAVLAAPGPNMLAVGAQAALRGFRGVVPFCTGIAIGAGMLSMLVYLLLDAMGGGVAVVGRAAGGAMLLVVALRVASAPLPRQQRAELPRDSAPSDDLVALSAGFGTAATNPVTAAYCTSQFLGPLSHSGVAPLAPAVVAAQALGFALMIALLFAQPGPRALALRHHRTVCLGSGVLLAALAGSMLWPLRGMIMPWLR